MTRIVSFHRGNLNPELVAMQAAVFERFQIPLEQILSPLTHPEAIDHFLATEPWTTVFLFDIDCIPLLRNIISTYQFFTRTNDRVIGAAQKASHIPNSLIYAGPCFMVLTRKVFEKLGKPSFKQTKRGDVGEEISYAARENEIFLDLIFPVTCDVPLWPLTSSINFGYGTNYGNMVYHAFESNGNHSSTTKFIEKAKSLLK